MKRTFSVSSPSRESRFESEVATEALRDPADDTNDTSSGLKTTVYELFLLRRSCSSIVVSGLAK